MIEAATEALVLLYGMQSDVCRFPALETLKIDNFIPS